MKSKFTTTTFFHRSLTFALGLLAFFLGASFWNDENTFRTLITSSLVTGVIFMMAVFALHYLWRGRRSLLRVLQRSYEEHSTLLVRVALGMLITLSMLLLTQKIQAQSCNCKEYIYLNEPIASAILKFEVGAPIPLTEKAGPTGTGHWYPGSGTSQLGDPHGLATDLNGKLYIGSSAATGAPIRQFDCDGNLSSTGGFVDNGAATFNMFSIGNTIYKSGNASIRAFNSCTGAFIGEKSLSGGTGGFYWGLSYNKATGTVYASEANGFTVWKMSVAELNDFSTPKAPLISKGPNATVNLGENYLPNSLGSVFGVVGDNSGNIYVVFSSFNGGSSSYILKYNSAGKLINQSPASPAVGGSYAQAIGIVWSETTNRLYTSNYTDDPASDCLSAFDASSMAYLGTAAPNPNLPADNRGKAIAILKECCPVNPVTTVNKTLCGVKVGDKFFLNQLADEGACDGLVCGRAWSVTSGTGFTFDLCDNSITVTDVNFCAQFTAAGSSLQCGAFSTTLNVCARGTIENPSPPTQSICQGSAGSDISVQSTDNSANLIRFVRFNTDQTANNAAPTATELAKIYAGLTIGSAVTPSGGSAPYTATLTAGAAGWAGLEPGTYYVYAIYNNDPGSTDCRLLQEVIVTIVDKPDLYPNDISLCETAAGAGATINLSDLVQNPDGATLSFLEGGNPVVQPLTVGSHTITVTGVSAQLGGCSSSINVTVTVNPFPTGQSICAGQTFTLTAPANATNVTWYRDGVAVGSGPVFTVDRPGAYSYIATSTATSDAGCQVSSCCPAVFTEGVCMSVGSTVWYDLNDNGIYDQPGENPIPGVKVELYDMSGNLVKSTITDPNGDYYFGFLAEGMYTVKVPGSASNPLLSTYVSSTNTNTSAKTDNNDNGDQPGGIGTVVSSEKFTLVHNNEPVGNAEFGSGGEQDNKTVPAGFTDTNTDDDGNMTIDFGFAPAPKITHEKTFVSAVPLSNHSFLVTYKITVKNLGAASTYNLFDTPFFDDDITINSASYTRDIPALGVTALPTTNTLTNTLGSDVPIVLGQTQVYTLTYNVTLDLRSSSLGDNIYTACGSTTPGNLTFGEGLFNQSGLDTNDDGTVDEISKACGDIPYITHNKDQVTVSSVPNADGTYTVVYTVQVKNLGGASGIYDLVDTPAFDNDIVISAASYSTTNVVPAVAGGALALINNQPNTLANDISIAPGVIQTYTLTYRVKLDLAPGSTDGGDNVYTKCGTTTVTPGPTLADASVPGQGLYNSTSLDLNNDKIPDEGDEICADIPYIIHTKKGPLISAQKMDRSYDITYTVEVRNLGGATGKYDLNDQPTFDDDIKINTASYVRDQPALGQTNLSLVNGANNVLGTDVSIDAGALQTYTLSYNVTLDLAPGSGGDNIYTKCGSGTPGNPIPGEGLYNTTSLDLNKDGIAEQTAKVCDDLPYVTHDKSGPVVSAQKADGSYDVTYTVKVRNIGGAAGVYTLYDKPTLENNITINSASYTSDIVGLVPNPLSLTNGTQNTLSSNQSIAAGVTQTYTLKYNVSLNLKTATPGVFDVYTACGSVNPNDPAPGEGLYNMTSLDDGANGSIDETDEVCGDLPYITHNKDQVSVSKVPNADGTYTVVYTVKVKNLGGAKGTYDLVDTPSFDDDIVIKTASYSTLNVVPAVAGGALALINKQPNTLANDISIAAFSEQTYILTYNVKLDLAPGSTDGGDNVYTKCGTTTVTPGPTLADASVPGQGLYNATALDTNNDNKPEEEDEICEDIPYIIHTKKGPQISAQKTDRSYDITYTVEVKNLGGATGIYDLKDTPTFDDDITIKTASYATSNVIPAVVGGALSTTNGVSNTLADDISIDAGAVQTYTLSYNVKLDLSPSSGGNNIYTACGSGTPGDPIPGEGLYNMTTLDLNNDGIIEQTSEVCGDLPYVTHDKSGPVIGAQLPNGSYPVTYTVTVRNTGGATGIYTLYDTPGFENNIAINNASYTSSTPPGLSGALSTSNNTANTLASGQNIVAGGVHTYTLSYNVSLNLKTNTPGVFDVYTACGSVNPNDPAPGEGLYNMTSLDDGANGSIDETDEVCGDLPYITHNKDQVSVSKVPNADGTYTVVYTVKVKNLGGAKGTYDLVDTPAFDDDIVIKTASYSTLNVVPAVAGGALALINKQPNTLANDIGIAAFDEQTYILTYNVKLDLAATSTDGGDNIYNKCGTITATPGATLADSSVPGQGLYNATALDTNNDNKPEEEDEICADIPYIIHAKAGPVISAQQVDGSYNVSYTVTVKNLGGAAGPYDLVDTPTFDDDITMNTASYTRDLPALGSTPLSTSNGASNILANDVIIDPGTTQTYTLSYNVTLNLGSASGGDNVYTACGTKIPGQINPGEGLYNKTTLDLNNDGLIEETAQVCGDLPVLIDYGDLPDTQPGVSSGDYQTVMANNGARHQLREVPNIYFGTTVDSEKDGQPDLKAGEDGSNGDDGNGTVDDEDGVSKPVMIFQGQPAKFTLAVKTNTPVYIYGYIDWNNDGKFDGPGEVQSTTASTSGDVMLTYAVPVNAVAGVNLGARFRIGSIESEVNVPNGPAKDGEVEDYLVVVKALDYGDLPAPYLTLESQDGPRHAVPATPLLYLGKTVDIDPDGQPDADAGEKDGGDDGDARGDDEDGVLKPTMLFQGEKASFQVAVVNKGASTAYVYGYIDWNKDGDFADAEEVQNTTVAASTSSTVTLTFNVPLGAVINMDLGARFRVGTDENQVNKATGFAMDGEVEDYLVRVKGLDYGDLNTPPYKTTYVDNGPRHGVSETPSTYLGGKPDVEPNGQPSVPADGDGADEDGVTKPTMLFAGEKASFVVDVKTTSTAYLYGYIDWNKDGKFDGPEEVQWASATASGPVTLTFNVPVNAVINMDLGARFRIGTVQSEVSQPVGFAMDGEVEDYLVRVKGLDYGDLPSPYPTTYVNNGARHGVSETPAIYLGGVPDTEVDGQPDNNANGDTPDEDGVTKPVMLFQGEKASFRVDVKTNTTAYIYGYIDWNKDGDFNDVGEVQNTSTSSNGIVTLTYDVPLNAVINSDLGVRFRIGSVQSEVSKPVGFAMDGEVEDYLVQVKGLDYGDLPDFFAGVSTGDYQTTYANNGARHGVAATPKLFLGSVVDVDADGQPDLGAGEDGTGGDDNDGDASDDEDGVVGPPMIFRGEEAKFSVTLNLTNLTGTTAYVYGFIDWNGNGILGDTPNEKASGASASSGPITLTFDVPLGAVANANLGARFRVGTIENEVKVPNGFAMDGEVEDYLVRVKGLDFGDLPLPYATTDAQDGPRHAVSETPQVYIGNTVDIDDDGQPDSDAGEKDGGDDGDADGDDEDGVIKPVMLFQGEKAAFQVAIVNKSASTAYVYGYIDWNKDGDFADAEEVQNTTVAASTSTTVTLTFNVPLGATINTDLGARFRVGTDESQVNKPTGFAMDGEVEDYLVRVKGLDYGDLPSPYKTTYVDNGPRHAQPENPQLYLGGVPDVEPNGQPDVNAGETGNGDGADEDGVVKPTMLFRGQEARFKVNVTNITGQTAFIYGYIDWNKDGDFNDAGEVQSATLSGSNTIELVYQVPLNAVIYQNLGARFRIGTVQSQVNQAVGFAMDGEIEDYFVQVKGLDFGDAGETFPTVEAQNGARHGVPATPDLYFGTKEDVELDGQPDDDAGKTGGGDDGNNDDEDGITMVDASGNPTMLITCLETTVRINTVIPANTTAYLQAWIDYNDDGDWADAGEQVAQDIALTSANGTYYLKFKVPCDAKVTDRTFLRYRLSTVKGLGYTGFAMDGEVEDYVEVLKGLDFGDLPTKPGTATFPTALEDNGPHHVLDPTAPALHLGAGVDADQAGTPSTLADSDDKTGKDDEDGITFLTPLIPGQQACIEIDATNNTGAPAKLYAYMDYDGDCVLSPLFNIDVPVGGLTDYKYCFIVPSDQSKSGGMAFFRFRLGTTASEVNVPTGLAMNGEVEDYKLQLAKVGNIVWFDRNADGIQNESEKDYGINGVMVSLIWSGKDGILQTTDPNNVKGDDAVYNTTTATLDKNGDPLVGTPGVDDKRGEYYFCGLLPGNYRIVVMNPTDMYATKTNIGLEDDRDSDGSPIKIGGVEKSVVDFKLEDPLQNPVGEDGIEDQEIIDGFPTNIVKTYPDNQVDQTIDFGFTSRDFGDLPEMAQGEMFPTTLANDGAVHTVTNPNLVPEIPYLYLGSRVDTEQDGQPTGMADGDDLNNVDDEDGIRILSPMVPGEETCIEVSSTIPSGVVGYLQGWIDWNGNGKLDDGEQVVDDYALVSGNGVVTKICFKVPSSAMFNEGMAFMRWRLSTERNLGFTGQALDGEVEDYKRQLGKVGNLVWEDKNFNGLQDAGEKGIKDQEVRLVWAGLDGKVSTTSDNKVYITKTDEKGVYYFCGLVEGNYKLIVPTPEDMTPSRPNVQANSKDVIDSDGSVMLSPVMDLSMVMDSFGIADVTKLPTNEDGLEDKPNVVGGFPDNQVDQTHDFGFAGLDYGDLPEEPQGEHFNTTMAKNGAVHVLNDELRLGQCADAERDGKPDDDAGVFDGMDGDQGFGDDGMQSKFSKPTGLVCKDDEDGIRFITPLIPGNEACIEVTYTAPQGGAVLQAWIDYNGNGSFNAGEELSFVGGGALGVGSNKTVQKCFTVPFNAIYNDGVAFIRFRLSPTGGLSSDGPNKYDETTVVPAGEVEDYLVKLAKVGNLVWEDRNYNGQQDDVEEDLGINGTVVALVFAGSNGTVETSLSAASFPLTASGDDRIYYDTTSTYKFKSNDTIRGMYYFCGLIEGTYDVVVLGPKDLTPTRPNLITTSQDEDKDSDGIETARNLTTQRTLSHAGNFTIASQKAICQLAEGEEGIGDQDLSNLLDVNNVGTWPDNQVDQRFDFGFIALDFGDLPQEAELAGAKFNTTIAENGPRHLIKPNFYLGSVVDAELDGNPDDQAGSSAYGASEGDDAADTDPKSWKQGVGNDDEDGIKFLTPLVPGYEACIEIKYALPDNFNGPDGYLNAWIDYNGNGTLDAGEKLAWTKLNGAAASIEPNTGALRLEKVYMTQGGGKVIVCFKVPADATYFTGNVLSRFRLSDNPRLGPDGILAPEPGYADGRIPCGEVEDYFMKLSKVGNLVWEDRNYNGLQDAGEPPIKGVPIKLEYAGLDGKFGSADKAADLEYTYLDTTDVDGRYYFCGLIGNSTYDPSGVGAANYQLTASDPAGMTPTVDVNGGIACNTNDSNGDDTAIDDKVTRAIFAITNPMGLCKNELHPNGINDQGQVGTFPDMQVDETYDFGYVGFDYGDLPVAGTSYLTLRDSMSAAFSGKFGPRHAIQPKLYLGEGVDGELNGQPDADAGSKNGGDDDGQGKFGKGSTTDDETGVRLLSPMIPGELAYIKVTYTSQDTVLAGGYANKNAYLRAFIDFNGDGDLNDADDVLTFTAAGSSMATLANIASTDNPILAGGVNQMQVLAFRVPLSASYRNGTAFMRYRLSWEANLGPDNNTFHQNTAPYVNTSKAYPRGEVEDYAVPLAKVGNLAWFDHDVKGDQNETDFVDTLQLVLVWGGIDETTGSIDSVGYQTTMASEGKITDVLYNLSIVPNGSATMPPASNDTPGQIVKTNSQGLYSFQGLIPGNYYLIPKKYLQGDSASFVNAWPKHRVLTLKDNPGVDDQNDSDGMPGALIRLKDGNSREPEVCVEAQPKNEAGRNDATDQAAMLAMLNPFPDSLYNQTIDFGWVDEPNIEANLDIVGVYFPTSEKCGNMNVILHMCVKNPQEVPLDSLQMFLNLKDAYGSALYTATKPKVSVADSAYIKGPAYGKKKKSFVGAKDLLTPNPNYDGVTDTRLLLVSAENKDFLLKGDSIVCLRIEFEIDPTKTDKYPWSIQGSTTARAVGFNKATGAKRPLTDYFVKSPRFGKTIVVSDLTDEIDDPMTTGDGIAFEGMVADRGYKGTYQVPYSAPNVTGRDKYLDENDKTIQNDECWLKTKWNAGQHDVVISMNSKCESIVNADILVPNFVPECGFDKYPEGSYYAVIIQDKETGETVWTSDDAAPFDGRKYLGRKLIYKVKSVTNFCNPIWGDLTLEDKTAPVVICPPNTDRKIVKLSPLVTAPYQFVCTDIDSVLNVSKSWNTPSYAYYTGIATTSDACGNARLESVADQLTVFADCALQAANGNAYARIRRVFTFIDENGNRGSCEQIISFYRPVIKLPECKVEVANYLAKGDTAVIPADLVGKYKLVEAAPYIINGAGKRIYATGQDICGFAFSYTDSYEFITGKGLCGRKIIRKWAIFDWCAKNNPGQLSVPTVDGDCYKGLTWNDSQYNWEQLIVIGDNTPPIVYALDVDNDGKVGSGYAGAPVANPKTETATYDPGDILVFSTGPMDCTGAFRFTKDQFKVLEQSDWCFEIVDIVERKPILDLFERPTGKFVMTPNAGVKITRDAGTDCKRGYTVAGVPLAGDWFVKLRVNNACYGDTVVLLPIQIKDKIAPTMKCDDQLNVTLDNVGTGYVTAKNLDEGSFDNCGALKWIKVRRPVNDTCMSTFLKSWRVIDVNKDGKIGAKDNKEDYIDFNYNGKADEGEYFTISETTKRLMTPLMDTIPVYCCDGGTVLVELWGEDRAGNRNYCWQNLKLDDKTPLVCMPPLNVTIKCNDKNLGLIDDKKASAKAFGDVLIMSGNTCVKADTTYKVVKNLTCGAGTIERIWTLSKTTAAGVVKTTCSQLITVEPIHEYSIRFPKDAVQKNCGKPIVDTVLTKELGCDILAVNVADKRYNATEDECYKIFRTYTVINWCTYVDKCSDPKAPENVYVVDRKFTNNGTRPIYVLVRQWKAGKYPAQTGSESDLQYFYSLDSIVNNWSSAEIGKLDDGKIEEGNDELLNDPSGDFKYPSSACGVQGKFIHSWMYTQIIKVYDDERPVVKQPKLPTCPSSSAVPGAATINFPIDPASCVGPVTIAFKGSDNCSKDLELEPGQIKIETIQDGKAVNTQLASDFDKTWSTARLASDSFKVSIKGFASGSYNLIVVIRDECGNLSVPTRIPFTVGDCKAPVPICINNLSTDLMPVVGGGGAMRVWAKDFIASPAYDCNGQGPDTKDGLKLITKYTINRVGKPASVDSIGITVTCADKGKAIPVEIHAWDEKGNHDFCVTALEVQDNRKVCPATPGSLGDGEIAGLIQTEAKQSVQGVSVELSGKAVKKMSTASDGKYDFTGLEKGYDYTVTPSLDANPLNGVSTFDLVLMQKHILGIQPLDSPYKMIAADINNSKSITTLDLILLRKLILNLDTKFTANTSWRFVDAAYRFPNPSNPWSEGFPEISSINNLNGKASADFVAVKIGDVNGNASPTSAAAAQPRKSGKLELSTEEQRIEGGQEYRVDIRAKDLQTIEGYQFTLELDLGKVDLVDLDYGVAKAENFGIFQREGIITTSWNRKGGAENEEAILFTLHLQGKGAAKLSEVLTISSRYTPSEAYQVGGDYLSVAMDYTKPVVISDRPELLQNTPNPFADQTQIAFYLPQATEGRLTIRDAKGSIVYRLKADYNKGWNQVTIKQSDLKAAGVLYYTLETPDFTATKKMVLLNR